MHASFEDINNCQSPSPTTTQKKKKASRLTPAPPKYRTEGEATTLYSMRYGKKVRDTSLPPRKAGEKILRESKVEILPQCASKTITCPGSVLSKKKKSGGSLPLHFLKSATRVRRRFRSESSGSRSTRIEPRWPPY